MAVTYTENEGLCPNPNEAINDLYASLKSYSEQLAIKVAEAAKANDCELEKRLQEQLDSVNVTLSSYETRITDLENRAVVEGLTPEQISTLAEAAEYFREEGDGGVSLKNVIDKLNDLETRLATAEGTIAQNSSDISTINNNLSAVQLEVGQKADKDYVDAVNATKADKADVDAEIALVNERIDNLDLGGGVTIPEGLATEEYVDAQICAQNKVIRDAVDAIVAGQQASVDAQKLAIDAIFSAACPVELQESEPIEVNSGTEENPAAGLI